MALQAQYITPVGARMNSLGNACVAVSDEFSLFSNPSGVAYLQKPSVALFADHRYNVSGLNTVAFVYNQPINTTCISTGVTRYGDELFNHSRIEMALAHKVRMVSLGIGLGYHQLAILENGEGRALTLQFGGMVHLNPKLIYGASIYNMLRAKVAKQSSIYYPVLMKAGFSYFPIKAMILSAEVEKDNRFDPNFKVGLEYRLEEWLLLRTGINNSPSTGFFGIGFKLKEWDLDYGLSLHQRLGMTHYLGLLFSMNGKRSETNTTNQ